MKIREVLRWTGGMHANLIDEDGCIVVEKCSNC